MTACPVCETDLHFFAPARVLGHVPAFYMLCPRCGVVALPNPTWLDEAYSDAISSLDVGLLSRCTRLARFTAQVIRAQRLSGGVFLDWAGGYGTLTRLMRDRGYDFRHDDPLCANIFARGHEAGPEPASYALATAFEVFEHLPDPADALQSIASSTDFLLFTTYLLPAPTPRPGQWWYYTPESGQHITFYTLRSLALLADRLGFQLLSDGVSRHLFCRGPLTSATRFLFSPQRRALLAGTARVRAAAASALRRGPASRPLDVGWAEVGAGPDVVRHQAETALDEAAGDML